MAGINDILGPLFKTTTGIDNKIGAVPGSTLATGLGFNPMTVGIGNTMHNVISKLPASPELKTVANSMPSGTNWGAGNTNNQTYVAHPETGTFKNPATSDYWGTFDEYNTPGVGNSLFGKGYEVPDNHQLVENNSMAYKRSQLNPDGTKRYTGKYTVNTPLRANESMRFGTQQGGLRYSPPKAAPLADPNAPQMRGPDYNWNGVPTAPTAPTPQVDFSLEKLLSPLTALIPGSDNSVWGNNPFNPNAGGSPSGYSGSGVGDTTAWGDMGQGVDVGGGNMVGVASGGSDTSSGGWSAADEASYADEVGVSDGWQ